MMRVLFATTALVCASAAFAWGACQPGTPTTGTQSDGAQYMVWMPPANCWNGDMVIFAHGYVAPGQPIAVPLDQLAVGGVSLPATFNQLGYGFAASSYSKNGLAIVQGFSDTQDLAQNVLKSLAIYPHRTYLIGASEGGLVTILSAEQLGYVYNAAGAACGPIGSFQSQVDYFGDFRVLFDYFFPGVLPGTAISIPSYLISDWTSSTSTYIPKVTNALAANPAAAAQLISVMHAAVTSDPATVAETVLDALWYNVVATGDAQTTLHGQPYDNHNRIYIGSANDLLLNLKVKRYTADAKALAAIAASYETSGKLNMNTVTLHTTLDPVVPYWQEPLYTLKTLGAGTLLERINLPVTAYGHCAFTAPDLLVAFGLMVLRDTGTNLVTNLRSALPEAQRADFETARIRMGSGSPCTHLSCALPAARATPACHHDVLWASSPECRPRWCWCWLSPVARRRFPDASRSTEPRYCGPGRTCASCSWARCTGPPRRRRSSATWSVPPRPANARWS